MSERNTELLLNDILEAIANIRSFVKNISFEQYEKDIKTKFAVERSFLIIGEAVSKLETDFKERHTQLDWRQIKDFRNLLVYDYMGVDDAIVWEIIQVFLDKLEIDIKAIIRSRII